MGNEEVDRLAKLGTVDDLPIAVDAPSVSFQFLKARLREKVLARWQFDFTGV